MAVSWTEEQQKVIDLRDKNILVSAAAGSGKTAVLVERIVKMITDDNHPIDIDRLLIVTFTNAAAAEMRERIGEAIESRLTAQPDNTHLQRQVSLIHNAQITTIHSFCLNVIRNHFNVIDLDPSFRIADEGELKLLKSEVIGQLLEDSYANKEGEFLHFIECYSTGKTDDKVEELILQLYHFSMSYPWPIDWLINAKKAYELSDPGEMNQQTWMDKLKENVTLSLSDLLMETDRALEMCRMPDGPYMYEPALESDKEILNGLLKCKEYEEYIKGFGGITYARLSPKKDSGVSDTKKEIVKGMREQVKKTLKSLKEQYFYSSPLIILEDMQVSGRSMSCLMDLTIEFAGRFQEKKADKNLLDFNDLEHFALNILVTKEEGKPVPSQAALDYADYFEEILIDEYQDSNMVQEIILNSISKSHAGRYNLFMVGDVKQSIYRFRLARPELFMDKYEKYSLDGEEDSSQRIDLHKNFRSRGQVLDSINFIFDQIMAKYLGNITYNEETALYKGAKFPEGNKEEFQNTQVLLIDLDIEDDILAEEGHDETARELEAKAIAASIKEIVGKEYVLDKSTQQYRLVRYSDVVILLRTIAGWADTFAGVLNNAGIPAYSTSSTGYFSALEIQTILHLLNIMDNPRQEIPMAAVLKSPIVGLSAEEMAIIKSTYTEEAFYEACILYSKSGEAESLKQKLAGFFQMLQGFRKKVPYTPMHELIWHILEETGYGDYIAALPNGEKRKANMDMLVEKAINYEATSYRGLFNFVRYIEHLQKYDVDFGEAGTIGENEDTVRIMSIHKSKGLEFPIVFASGMGKSFNTQDSRSKIVTHPDLGIGADAIDPILRTKAPTLLKKVIQRQTALENLGEELRVLYVALTRAKEKLILTGTISKLKDKLTKWISITNQKEQKLSFHQLSKASTYWEWILPSLMRHPAMADVLSTYELQYASSDFYLDTTVDYEMKVITFKDVIEDEIISQVHQEITKEELKNWDTDMVYDETIRKKLTARLQEVYPFERDADVVTKVTVSEMKKRGQNIDEEYSKAMYSEPDIVPLIPNFMKEESEVSGAARGSAYHKILECLDVANITSKQMAASKIEELLDSGKITKEIAKVVNPYHIFRFAGSDLAKRMIRAKEQGLLYKEQQFVIGVDAPEIDKNWSSGETVLIQGIIDVFFYEDDEIIVADYKTDYIEEGNESELVNRYGLQLDYYKEALERVTGKKVKEKIIYSFSLLKEIILPAH